MRVFADANVLVSASWSAEAALAKLWLTIGVQVVTIDVALADAERAIESKSRVSVRNERMSRLLNLSQKTEILRIDPGTVMLNSWNIADPDDVAIVWGAIRGRCEVLVTGDNDFAAYFGTVRDGVRVLRPSMLMQELQNLSTE